MGQETKTYDYRDPGAFPASVDGLELLVIPDGQERLRALLELIDGAKSSLKLCFYIFAKDDTGTAVRDALARAAERGVATTLIVDGYGAEADEEFMRPFCDAGGDFRSFSSRRSLRYLIRNHQKMAIADDEQAIIGGFNVEDDYFAPPAVNGWNDLAVRITGDAMKPLLDWYAKLIEWTDADGVEWRQVRREVKSWSPGDGDVRWVVGGPTRGISSWAKQVGQDLSSGNSLHLMMAYFSPPKSLMQRIGGIAKRGEATLIMAGKSDNGATIGASRSLYHDLLESGAHVHEFMACKMHTKLLVVDDVTYIGSANFDMRSLFINLEIMLRVEDADFADRMRSFIEDHLPASRHISKELHAKRNTLWNRIRWNASWFLVSVADYTVSRRLNLGL